MDNNSADKTPVMGAAEEREILDTIENYISASTKDTTLDTESTGADVNNTGLRIEITGVGI